MVSRLSHCCWVAVMLGACAAPVAPPCLGSGLIARPDAPIGFPGEIVRAPVLLAGRPQTCFATTLTAQATVSDPDGLELPAQVLGLQNDGNGFLEAVVEFRPRSAGPHFVQVSFEPNLGRSGGVVDVATRGSFSLHRAAQAPMDGRCTGAAVLGEGRVLCISGTQLVELREDAGTGILGNALDVTERGDNVWSFTQQSLTRRSRVDGGVSLSAIPCEGIGCESELSLAYLAPSGGDEALLITQSRVLRTSDMAQLISLPDSILSSASWPEGSTQALVVIKDRLMLISPADAGVAELIISGTPAGADAFGVWVTDGALFSHYGFLADGGVDLVRVSAPARVALTGRLNRLRDGAPLFEARVEDSARGWLLRHDGSGVVFESLPALTERPLFAQPRHVFAGSSQGKFEWLTRDGR